MHWHNLQQVAHWIILRNWRKPSSTRVLRSRSTVCYKELKYSQSSIVQSIITIDLFPDWNPMSTSMTRRQLALLTVTLAHEVPSHYWLILNTLCSSTMILWVLASHGLHHSRPSSSHLIISSPLVLSWRRGWERMYCKWSQKTQRNKRWERGRKSKKRSWHN